jgi:hypothetical protein
MDMNFPHHKLEWTAFKNGSDAQAQSANHQALLTRAIARQASSQSAKKFVAARQGLRGIKETVRPSFMNDMDERMAFFAGRFRTDRSGRGEAIPFRTGCFRPDLARQEYNKMHG